MIKDGINLNNDENIRSFLMIGQSNMAGRGEFRDVEPIENPRCHMLRMGRWQQMYEPINPDRDIFKIKYHSGISLAASGCLFEVAQREVGTIYGDFERGRRYVELAKQTIEKYWKP